MSDFLAEARVIVRPDTTRFRAELEAQLLAATKGVTLPIPVTAVPTTTAAATAVQEAQAKATADTAASTKALTVAQQEQAGAQAALTASSLRLTTAQRAEVRANQLLDQSARQLAEAETIASLKTTELAANRARLAASSRAVATAERAVLSALASENAALTVNARQTLANAVAQEALFRERVANTIAANTHAAALEREAASQALVARGAGATALSLAGARGATLAASSGFLVGAAAAVFFAESIKQAVDAEETFRRTSILLGDELAQTLAGRAEGIGEAFALDDDDVLKFQTQIGGILKVVGFADEEIANVSSEVVKLAADMAAFNDVPVEKTLKAIQTGLAGNVRGLKQYNVLLNAAEVEQTALAESGKKNADELTRAELVQARFNLILRDAGFQQGALAAQSESLTGQARILRVQFEELQETIGKGLVPAVTGLVKGLNDTFDAFNAAGTAAKGFGSALPIIGDDIAGIEIGGFVDDLFRLNTQAVLLGPVFGPIALGMKLFGDETKEAGEKLTVFDKIVGSVRGSLLTLSNALDEARSNFPTQAQRDELGLTLAQAGGDSGAELAILQEREARQAAFLEKVLDRPATTQNIIKLQTRAAEQLDETRDRINAILEQQAGDASKAASEAGRARNEADRALLSMLGGQQDRARDNILRAQGTAQLQDDIKFHEQFRRLLERQKDIVAETVRDAQTKARELRTLTSALIQVGQEIKSLRRKQREAQQAAQEERLERLETGTRLDIELADINENTKRRVKLREDLIRQLLRERRILKLTGNALKENRNEIARIRKEIEAINEENSKVAGAGRSFQQDTFEFLQAQQGFAANLFGNLIPGGATGGLVGNVSPDPRTQVATGLGTAAGEAEGRSRLGITAGQGQTTNHLLQQILRALRELNRSSDAPEARYQRAVGSATMDGAGGGTMDASVQ